MDAIWKLKLILFCVGLVAEIRFADLNYKLSIMATFDNCIYIGPNLYCNDLHCSAEIINYSLGAE